MSDLHIADAIDEIFVLLRRSNKYIDETTPWVLAKDPAKKEPVSGLFCITFLRLSALRRCCWSRFCRKHAQSILQAQLNTKVQFPLTACNSFDGMKAGDATGKSGDSVFAN